MSSASTAEPNDANCRNCGAPLQGQYCSACGQKALVDSDRRFSALLASFVSELSSIDGKFWRSIGALLFRPGLLSRAWLDGQRQRYMSPVTLFLLANAIYFLSPGLSDFDLTLRDQTLQVHSRWTRPLLDALLAARGLTIETFAVPYATASGNVGKLLLIVHAPFMALALKLWRREAALYYAEHLVVALHLLTFVLLFIQLQALVNVSGLYELVGDRGEALLLPLLAGTYLVLACRRSYNAGRLWALFAGFITLAALLFANLYVYRPLQFLLALALA